MDFQIFELVAMLLTIGLTGLLLLRGRSLQSKALASLVMVGLTWMGWLAFTRSTGTGVTPPDGVDLIAPPSPLILGMTGSGMVVVLALGVSGILACRTRVERMKSAGLLHERNRFETLVNSIDGIVWEFDLHMRRYTYVSKQTGRILLHEPAQWLEDPEFRTSILHPDDRWAMAHWHRLVQLRKPYEFDYRVIAGDGRTLWMRETGIILTDKTGTPSIVRGTLRDVTALKEVDAEMKRLNDSLLIASRNAGMAEVATSVLHNVGNVLNSISVSASVASTRMKESRAGKLRQAALMMRGHNGHLAEFLTEDPKGQLLPEYLDKMTEQLAAEHEEVIGELGGLNENIMHVKEIVAMQQDIASSTGVLEFVHPAEMADDALRMTSDNLQRSRVRFTRQFSIMPPKVRVDRHKVLQILVNLIQNAMHAMDSARVEDKHLVIGVNAAPGSPMVAISIKDNGIGISPGHLTEIFRHGFTTKKDGHGFGLHSSANFAKELGGSLSVHSDGPGHGAEFILTLPAQTHN